MDRSLLVRIFVPAQKKRAASGRGGGSGKCGTGYPVSERHVLTARHVVCCEGRDTTQPISLRWADYPDAGPNGGCFKVGGDKIVWEDEGLDAALIECPRPAKVRGHGILLEQPPRDGVPWVGCGFPQAAKYTDGRTPASFGGTTYRSLPGTNSFKFELDVRVSPEEDELWAGASGMPVCRENSRIVIGVVRAVAPNVRSQKLLATPSSALLAVPKVRQLLGYDDAMARCKVIEARVVRLLGSSEKARTTLSSMLEGQGAEAPSSEAGLAKALLGLSLDKAIRCFWDAHETLCIEKEDADPLSSKDLGAALDVLRRAAETLAPHLFDGTIVAETRAHTLAGTTTLLEIPCVKETVAEVIMASVDGRPAEFRPRQHQAHYPLGRLAVATLPELGIVGAEQTTQAMREELARKFHWGPVRGRIDDALFRRFVVNLSRPDASPEDKIRLAAIEMANESGKAKTFYMLCRFPSDEDQKRQLRVGIDTLRRDYPQLVILCLSGDAATEEEEARIFGRFARMLPIGMGIQKEGG
jgi:hypothetical protein